MNAAIPPVYVALDVNEEEIARAIVKELGDACTHYKIGLELYHSTGKYLVKEMIEQGKKIFLDMKFHDIPNTVYSAMREVASLGVEMVTVHALGGTEMLKAAKQGAREGSLGRIDETKVLAVTILTSQGPEELKEIGFEHVDLAEEVDRLAAMAESAGVFGIVCSPHEVNRIKKQTSLHVVVPGIRPADSALHDQKRASTPSQAVRAGADSLVIGRPVVQAKDRLQALLLIQEEIRTANLSK